MCGKYVLYTYHILALASILFIFPDTGDYRYSGYRICAHGLSQQSSTAFLEMPPRRSREREREFNSARTQDRP